MDRNVYGKKGIQSELEQKRCQIKHLPFDSNSERGISANPIWRSEETSGRLIRWRLARHRVTSVDQIRSGAGHGRLELFCFYGDGPARGKRGRCFFFPLSFFLFKRTLTTNNREHFKCRFPSQLVVRCHEMLAKKERVEWTRGRHTAGNAAFKVTVRRRDLTRVEARKSTQ